MPGTASEEGEKVWVPPPEPKIEPHINASIWPTGDGQWALGNLMLCERIAETEGSKVPSDTLVTWLDGQGVKYYLRPQTVRPSAPKYDPSSSFRPKIPRHFTSALFEIGCDVLVKVKYAPSGWPRWEGLNMKLVREGAPSVPIPEAIHYWFDEEWDRYFVIQRSVHGPLLGEVWFDLSRNDRWQVARELALYIKQVAAIRAPRFQNANGGPNGDGRLLSGEPILDDEDDWGPLPAWPGPFAPEEFRDHLRKVSDGVEPPEIGSEFHFYHGDLPPSNIILSGTELEKTEGTSHVHVAAIIDWENAGFYPKFWLSLYIRLPLANHFLDLTEEQYRERPTQANEYASMLVRELVELGFPKVESLAPWWEEFCLGKRVVMKRRAKELELEEAAKGLHVK